MVQFYSLEIKWTMVFYTWFFSRKKCSPLKITLRCHIIGEMKGRTIFCNIFLVALSE